MHIKQIIIQGFKSYGEQIVLKNIDKRLNVVMGRNASCKSDFFDAIHFVLSHQFSYLYPEQRLFLLHKGIGPQDIAFVEILFDNSDYRIPIDKNEIYIRRAIGYNMDQFLLNKEVVHRSEVFNLLESAGLSKSNPYYIVNQRQIDELAVLRDSDRLRLLRDVAGTRVYEEQKQESVKILRANACQLEKINELVHVMEQQFQMLDEDKAELKEYQRWGRSQTVLEFIIHEREHKRTLDELQKMNEFLHTMEQRLQTLEEEKAKLQEDRRLERSQRVREFGVHEREHKRKLDELEGMNSGRELHQYTDSTREIQGCIRNAIRKLKDANKEITAARGERERLSTELQQLLREKTNLDLAIEDLTGDVDGDLRRCRKKSSKQLIRELESANQHLKKYNHVKKETLEQNIRFLEQKKKIYKRKEEVVNGGVKLRELIDMLEHNKLEAIKQTFKQMSVNFTNVFKKLVPQGHGILVMKVHSFEGLEINDTEVNVDQIIGLCIKVSFTDEGDMCEMNQLSSVQKRFVALVFIFAIQRCDPAPFYLFHLDQALEENHRKAVANMIHEVSCSAQFITSACRPELLVRAQKLYSVKFCNNSSYVECLSQGDARDIVEDSDTDG